MTIATDPVKKHQSPQTTTAQDFVQQAVIGRFAGLMMPANFMLGEPSAAAMVD